MTGQLITQKEWNAKLRELRVARERITDLEGRLRAESSQQEPVATVTWLNGCSATRWHATMDDGTYTLYAAPVAKPAAQEYVKLQSGRDGVWVHCHAGDQHFSYCLENDWMAKKFCNAYRAMLAASKEPKT